MTFEATYLGSNGWLIKFEDTNLIIDPWITGDLIFSPGEWFFKGSLENEILIDQIDNQINDGAISDEDMNRKYTDSMPPSKPNNNQKKKKNKSI